MNISHHAGFFQMLGDPTRLAIFDHLSRGEISVGELAEHFPISQPAVSQHLGVLREWGLVDRRREGRNMYYSTRSEGLAPLLDWLSHYQAFWPEKLDRLKSLMKEMNHAPRK
jgi:DNA-binding transcriptional ArsR family regulator